MANNKYNYNYISLSFTYEGKRYRVRGKTQAEAEKKKIDKLVELKTTPPSSEKSNVVYSPNTLVDDWVKISFDTYKKGKDTRSRYKNYVQPAIGRLPISKVTAIQCQTILNQAEGKSFSLVDKLRQEISFIFETAVDNDLIQKNPAKRLILPDNEKRSHRSITDQEREYIYKVYKEDPQFIYFIIMLKCGCRPGEVAELIGKDINTEDKSLHIRGTKTARADRTVGIPDDLFVVIKDTPPFDPIVHNRDGRKYNKDSYKRLSKSFKRALNLAMGCRTYRNELIPPFPLAEDFEPYCLRHTFCTDLCKAGVDVRTAQKLMGHANISITAEIYTHVDQDQILDARDKLENYYKEKNIGGA